MADAYARMSGRVGVLSVHQGCGLTNAMTGIAEAGDDDEGSTRHAVSLAWTALTPATTADAIFDLNTATTFADFRQAARSFAVPSQNLVYADIQGNIGYQAPGAIPVRDQVGDGVRGRQPSPGWDSRYDWQGYVPFEDLPWALNPLLMLGGAFLCFEGFEKLAHKFLHAKHEDEAAHRETLEALADPTSSLGVVTFDEEHARRVADLTVYVRQHHGDRDLARTGALLVEAAR